MLTLLIVFSSVFVAGLGFWFYNRRQVSTFTEKIDDKTAIITALRNHVDQSSSEPTTFDRSQNLTPSVEEALSQNKNKNRNKNRDGGGNRGFKQKKHIQSAKDEFTSEKKNRPKPRKPKPQQ